MEMQLVAAAIAGIQQRRELLIKAWCTAIHEVCGQVAQTEELVALLHSLLDEILDALQQRASLLQAGYGVGRDLSLLACRRPEILGQTTMLFSRHFLSELTDAQRQVLQPAVAILLGGMAQGFLDEADATVDTVGDKLEEMRRAERRYYTTILDMIDALIVVSDASGHIVGFNGAAERLSGYSFDDVYGRHYTFLQAPQSYNKTATLVERLKSLPPEQRIFLPHQSIWVTREGERREIEWSTTAIYSDDGIVTFVIGTGTDVTVNRQMERELAEAHRQLTQVKEAERLRLAQDLHDDAVQQLLGIGYQVAEMQRRALETGVWTPTQRLEELVPGLEVIRSDIVAVSQGLRRLISSLRPPALREMGLAEILDLYVSDWRQLVGHDGPRVQLDIESIEGEQLPEPVATCLYRLVQEGIWNAHKHAAATTIRIIMRRTDGSVFLRIKDDGLGFIIPRHMFQFAAAGRFGLLGMQERVLAVDGLLSVWSEPGQGTEIQAHIPLVPWSQRQ